MEHSLVLELAAKLLAKELERSYLLIKQLHAKTLKSSGKKILSIEAALKLCREMDVPVSAEHLSAIFSDGSASLREDADEFANLLIALGLHGLRNPWFKSQVGLI